MAPPATVPAKLMLVSAPDPGQPMPPRRPPDFGPAQAISFDGFISHAAQDAAGQTVPAAGAVPPGRGAAGPDAAHTGWPVHVLPVLTMSDWPGVEKMHAPQTTRLLDQLSDPQITALPLRILAHFNAVLTTNATGGAVSPHLARLHTALLASLPRLTQDKPAGAVRLSAMVRAIDPAALKQLPQATRDALYCLLRATRTLDVSVAQSSWVQMATTRLLRSEARLQFNSLPTDGDYLDILEAGADRVASVVDGLSDASLLAMDRRALTGLWLTCSQSHPAQAERMAVASLERSATHQAVTAAMANFPGPSGTLRVCSVYPDWPTRFNASAQTFITTGAQPEMPGSARNAAGHLATCMDVVVQRMAMMQDPYLIANEARVVPAYAGSEARFRRPDPSAQTDWVDLPMAVVWPLAGGMEVEVGTPGQDNHARLTLPD